MAYVGRSPRYGFLEGQTATFNGSTTVVTLQRNVSSTDAIDVFIDNVHQEPDVAYTLSSGGNSITFTGTPDNGAVLYIRFHGLAFDTARAYRLVNSDEGSSLTLGNDDTLTLSLDGTTALTATSSGITIPNLTVTGTTTSVNSTNLNIGDNTILLNSDVANDAAPTESAGITINRGSSADVDFIWNETTDEWYAADDLATGGIFRVKGGGTTPTLSGSTLAAFTRSAATNNASIAIIGNSGGYSSVHFGDENDEDVGQLNYSHTADTFALNKGLGVTGNITVSGTVDGVDIATRDGVLTSTTTTAGAALPKAGGTMTGALTINQPGNSPQFRIQGNALWDFYSYNDNNLYINNSSGTVLGLLANKDAYFSKNLSVGDSVLSTYHANYPAIDIGSSASVQGFTGNNGVWLQSNLFMNTNGHWTSKSDDYSAMIELYDGNINFYNTASGTGTRTLLTPMTIRQSGKIGINSPDPNFLVHIKGSTQTNAVLAVESSTWSSGSTAEIRLAYVDGHHRSIKGHYDNGMEFYTNSTDPAMTIDGSGNISIGSNDDNPFNWSGSSNNVSISSAGSNDWAQLSLKGNGTGGTGINLGSGSVRHAGIFSMDGSKLAFATNPTNSGTSTSTAMTILSNGKVGISCEPTTDFDVDGQAFIGNTSTNNSLRLRGQQDGNVMQIYSGGVNRFNIHSQGTGTDYLSFREPSSNNYEMLTIAKQGQVIVNRNQVSTIDIVASSDNEPHMLFVDAGNDSVKIGSTSGSALFNVNKSVGGTDPQFADFRQLSNGNDARVMIATAANAGGDPFLKFDAGGSNMIVGLNWHGTTQNKLKLGAADRPSDTIKGIIVNGAGHVSISATDYESGLASSNNGKLGHQLGVTGSHVMQRNANSTGAETIIVNNIHSSGASIGMMQYRTFNSVEGSLNGNSSGLFITNNSDYRKKENITDATGCLTKITGLRPVTYTHRSEYDTDTNTVHTGFIAHEVSDHMPSIVEGAKDAVDDEGTAVLQSVAYSDQEMITNLVGAIKELQAENEAMRTRLDAIEAQ